MIVTVWAAKELNAQILETKSMVIYANVLNVVYYKIMDCTNFIAYEKPRKKGGKSRRIAMRPDWVENTKKYNQFIIDPVPCTGTLKINLNVSQGCCCHEPDPELNVNFVCSECGPIDFDPQFLPCKYDLVDWINALMENTASLSFLDTTTIANQRQDVRNGAVASLMAKKGLSDSEAYTEVMQREMKEAEAFNHKKKRKT